VLGALIEKLENATTTIGLRLETARILYLEQKKQGLIIKGEIMKDFKLPRLSKEERQIQWDNLKIGDKLACFSSGGWNRDLYVKYYTVIKKTPKGSIRLSNGDLLKSFVSDYFIVTGEVKECVKKIMLEDEIFSLLYEINSHKGDLKKNMNYEDALILKGLLKKMVNQ